MKWNFTTVIRVFTLFAHVLDLNAIPRLHGLYSSKTLISFKILIFENFKLKLAGTPSNLKSFLAE